MTLGLAKLAVPCIQTNGPQHYPAPPGVVSIGRPLYTELTGGHAYMIYPATFTNVQKGKTVVYKGTWTMTLRKARGGWTFTGSSSNWGGNYTVRSGG